MEQRRYQTGNWKLPWDEWKYNLTNLCDAAKAAVRSKL